MIERVLLVAWKGAAATAWVDQLRAGGYIVLLEDTTGERAWRTAKERGIDVVIIDGQKKPSHGRQTGHSLRDTAKTREIPIIWTNLDTEDAAAVQAEVHPDLTLAAPTDALEALAALQSLSPRVHGHSHALASAVGTNAAAGATNGHALANGVAAAGTDAAGLVAVHEVATHSHAPATPAAVPVMPLATQARAAPLEAVLPAEAADDEPVADEPVPDEPVPEAKAEDKPAKATRTPKRASTQPKKKSSPKASAARKAAPKAKKAAAAKKPAARKAAKKAPSRR